MADYNFNPGNDIIVADSAPNYWHYSDDKDNRFNKVTKINGQLVCERDIDSISDINTHKSYLVNECKTPLYIVFLSEKQDKLGLPKTEEMIVPVKINWKN